MPRRQRHDKPGCLHHVTNRGQDRQRIYSHRRDYRFFLALLVCTVRAGKIHVHSYCLMPNHFHLLVESVDGDLSATMRWIQGRYGAYFNASHKHTGHAFGGRFHSMPVTTTVYLFRVIRYIDRNPWVARRHQDPLQFPWGSATHHARSTSHPIWLARNLVDPFLVDAPADGPGRQAAYREAFQINVAASTGDDLVERRMIGSSRIPDDLDTLVAATPDELARWLIQRASSAPGQASRLAMVDTDSVLRAVAEARVHAAPTRLRTEQGRARNPWPLVESGLLHDLAGLTFSAAAATCGVTVTATSARYARHCLALQEDAAYPDVAASTAYRALRLSFGPEVRRALLKVEENA